MIGFDRPVVIRSAGPLRRCAGSAPTPRTLAVMHRRRSVQRRWRVAAGVAACLLLVACEPAAGPDPDAAETPTGADEAALGAPAAAGMPASLADLRETSASAAAQWQDDPVLVSMEVELDADGRWTRATATFLAPDADRMYEHVITPEGTSADRPTLATLGLQPVTGSALAEVPDPPEDLTEPAPLAETARPQLEECGAAGRPAGVLYTTGAPVVWDGSQWTQELRWTATVRTDQGGAIVVDPVSGEQLPGNSCVPQLEPTEGAGSL